MSETAIPPTTVPIPNFEELLSNPVILAGLKERLGFTAPTPIQVQAIPVILSGKDLYAGAKTGSGKTIAFVAPIVERIFKGEIERALVLAPTRELVLQMDEEAMKLLEGQTHVVPIPLYGGVPTEPQVLALRTHKPRLIIATPGRVLDLAGEGSLNLANIQVGVLDEADRMCDMGFAPQVSQILNLMTDRKQMLLFSATLPKELTEIMNQYCPAPERIQVDANDQASDTLHHRVLFCSRRDKLSRLLYFFENNPEASSVSFVRTRNRADEAYDRLKARVPGLAILHAGLHMTEREQTLRALKDGKVRHLIATDVFARGIDVDTLTHVFHLDLPQNFEEYIHRSGRSGRAGRQGVTVAFVEMDQRDQVAAFKSFSTKVDFETADGSPMPDLSDTRSFQNNERGHAGEGRGGHREGGHREGGHRETSGRGGRSGRPSQGSRGRGGYRERPQSTQPRPARAASASQPESRPKKGLLARTQSLIKSVFGNKKKD